MGDICFGDVLRKLLDEQGITQKQLANNLNISPSALGNYIRNIREPDFAMAMRIADYFCVSIDYLLNRGTFGGVMNQSEADIIRIFRALTPEQQLIFIEQGKAFLKNMDK